MHPQCFYPASKAGTPWNGPQHYLIIGILFPNHQVLTACRLAVNQSYGAINVPRTRSYHTSLYCSLSIGNAGIPQAIGLFLIQEINFGYCRYSLYCYFTKSDATQCQNSNSTILSVGDYINRDWILEGRSH